VARGVGVDPELAPLPDSGGVESLAEYVVAPVLDGRPDDLEGPVLVRGHGGGRLQPGRVGVDLELGPLRRSGRVEPPAEDAVVVAVLTLAGPYDDEVATGVGGHPGRRLIAGGERADVELASLAGSGRGEALAEDAISAPILGVAMPYDDEVAIRLRAYDRRPLHPGGVGVDLELDALGDSKGVEELAGHAQGLVRAIAAPHHDEVPVDVRGDRGVVVQSGGVGVDAKLAPLPDPGGVETLAEDAVTAGVLADAQPDDDEIPVAVRGHGGDGLGARRVGVDLELEAQARSRRAETLAE